MTDKLLLLADRVIDGSGHLIDRGGVLVEGDLIIAVSTAGDLGRPAGVPVIDLGGTTLMPGLIDVHNHVTFPGDARVVQQVVAHDTTAMLTQGRTTAANLLAAGVTTVRDLGALGDTAFQLAAEIAAGQTPGPHIVTSTAQLTAVGGPNAALGGGCADLAAARDRIDADAAQGARVVKLIATGSITDTGSDPTRPVFSDATVAGIVDHAHARGMSVAAHAHGTAGIVRAARCGVDTIEHASFLTPVTVTVTDTGTAAAGEAIPATLTSWPDPDALAVVAEHNPWIVPTLAATFAHTQATHATPASLRMLAHRSAIGRALLDRGLRLVAGTDGGGPGCPNLSLVTEIERLHQLGLDPLGAISAATGGAAACIGLTDRGVLREGARADVIAVPGNPLTDLGSLRAPQLVMIGGRIAHRVQESPQVAR